MTNYNRVIPRDFFNESKLLKCMGQLSLAILDGKVPEGISIVIEECGDAFQIELLDDGYLFVANYQTFVNGRAVAFKTAYNSKRPFPFYCTHPDSEEDIEVFDDDGRFSEEFCKGFAREAA